MKARLAVPSLAAVLLLALPGCPDGKKPPPPPPGPDVAAPSTASAVAETWAAQAELVAKKLDALVVSVEKGDKEAALALHESAYFECYENAARNLEVASQRFLPEEPLDGRPRNVAIVREDLFAQVKSAVKSGAPLSTVRALVDELEKKIRDDAKKLDDMKVAPP